MRSVVLSCVVLAAATSGARADCEAYAEFFLPHAGFMDEMHNLDQTPEYRTEAANAIGYMFGLAHRAAEGRQLHEMQACMRLLFVEVGRDLPVDAEIAYTLGWSGVLRGKYSAFSQQGAEEMVAQLVALAAARAIADGTAAPVIAGGAADASEGPDGVGGEWRGAELSITVNGETQTSAAPGARLNLNPDGRYRMTIGDATEFGNWSFDDGVLSLLADETDTGIRAFSVSFHGNAMTLDLTRHDGQWHERWVWQR